MTDPTFAPTWLKPADVAEWLHLQPIPEADLGVLTQVCAAVEITVQRYRPDGRTDTGYTPDAEIYSGATMMAARVFRRRNTASGIETFADSVAYVANRDPDIQAFLHTGPFARPRTG
jgi:hypothetical protein